MTLSYFIFNKIAVIKKYTMSRMHSKQNPHTLLLKMEHDSATIENSSLML